MSMTFGNRIVAALLMATLVLSLGYLIVGSIPASDPVSKTVRLYGGQTFDQDQKRAAEYAISKGGLTGHQWIGDQLQVPKNKESAYIAALAADNVLKPTDTIRHDTASKLSPWDSSVIMDKRMITSTEMQCQDAIKMLPGIASVKVSSYKRPAWERNVWARTQITSVSVSLEAIENKPLPSHIISSVSAIVSRSFGITNLKEISIVDGRHGRSYDGSGEDIGDVNGAYARHQQTAQEEWEKRIYELFSHIDGLKVKASVDLTKYREQKTFQVEHDKPTVLVNHELDYQFLKEGYARWWRPGVIAQFNRTLIDPTGDMGPTDKVDEKKREVETTNALPGTETKEEALPFIPLRVTIAIQIPREHLLKRWREKNRLFGDGALDAKPTPEELLAEEEEMTLDTKRSVAKLIENYRISNKTDPMELVDVTYSLPPREIEPELTAWQQFMLFLQEHWQHMSLMSMVFCGMMVLWLISKPQKPDSIVLYEGHETPLDAIDARIAEKLRREEEEAARLAAEEAAARGDVEEFENSLGELGSLRTLRDEIAELIAKNPDAAAAVIRQWIGNAVLVEAKS